MDSCSRCCRAFGPFRNPEWVRIFARFESLRARHSPAKNSNSAPISCSRIFGACVPSTKTHWLRTFWVTTNSWLSCKDEDPVVNKNSGLALQGSSKFGEFLHQALYRPALHSLFFQETCPEGVDFFLDIGL